MKIGWLEFLRRYLRKPSEYHVIGIELGVAELYISTFQKKGGELLWVKQDSLPMEGWQKHLKNYVAQESLTNTACNLVLSIAKYQMLQLDKPAVAESELHQALQWSVKEQFPSENELIFDFFDHPASLANAPKINVVALEKNEIQNICEGILQAGLELNSIDIEELATCNLVPASEDAVITLFQESGDQICLNIVKQNNLYFSRRLRGYENLSSFSVEELQMGVSDTLSVEIQRSMDYFESQLRQAPVKKIYLAMDSPHQDALAELVKQLTFMPVEVFKPNIKQPQEKAISAASFACLGAAIGISENTVVKVGS